MLTCKVARALMEWNPVNERIITARFYSRFIKTTVIQVYAPTNDYTDEDKDAFYEQLQATWNKAPKHDVKIVMGDFNAKVDESNQGHEEHMGTHGLGVREETNRILRGEQLGDIGHNISSQRNSQGYMDISRRKNQKPDRPYTDQPTT